MLLPVIHRVLILKVGRYKVIDSNLSKHMDKEDKARMFLLFFSNEVNFKHNISVKLFQELQKSIESLYYFYVSCVFVGFLQNIDDFFNSDKSGLDFVFGIYFRIFPIDPVDSIEHEYLLSVMVILEVVDTEIVFCVWVLGNTDVVLDAFDKGKKLLEFVTVRYYG